MKHYQIDEFIHDTTVDTMEDAIDKKVSLLYDLCILTQKDSRETALREVLAHYTSEYTLTTALHDVVVGKKSLDTFLAQKRGASV